MSIFHSIKFRIVAFGLLLAVTGILVRQYLALPMMHEQIRDLAAAQQLSIATYIANDVDHNITSRLALIAQFAGDMTPDIARQPQKLQTWIGERQRINPAFSGGLIAVRPDGRGLLAEYPVVPGRVRLDFAEMDWFQSALRSNKPIIGKPASTRLSSDPRIVFAAPVRDAAGNTLMVLAGVALLNTPGFLELMQETKLGTSGGFLLISPADKLFVASSDPSMVLKPTPPPGVNLLHDRAMAGYRGTGVTINAKGVEELSAMVTVPSTGWYVVARMPTAEAFRPVKVLRDLMYKVSSFLLLVIVVTLLFLLPYILRPLTIAARAMREMAAGTRPLAPLPVTRKDEVGDLLQGFNVLVERLRKEETARQASEEKLTFLAQHDSLTGLYNRAALEDRLEQALARAERDGSQVALLFCDLDGFKEINDLHGHDAGDDVLRQVSVRLSDGRRRVDTVARLGGDEFVILLAGLDDARAGATVVARQSLQAIGEDFVFGEKSFKLGLSIGIACHSGTAIAPSYLISQADIAMYHVKRKGKGDFFFIDECGA